jgi:hypothetical protein
MHSESKKPATAGNSTDGDSLRKLRIEFWTKRLDHTNTHTDTSSRFLYLIDGAVLGLLAFAAEKLKPSGAEEIFYLAIPIAILALLNYYHIHVIRQQRAWYNAIDQRIRERLDNEPELKFERGTAFGSTHLIYVRIHSVIACILIIAAIFIGVHGYITR